MNTQEQIKYLEGIEKFIKHNINLEYIKPDTTVEELLQFIKNVKENYILMIRQVENIFNIKEEKCEHDNKYLLETSAPYKVQDGDILCDKKYKCRDCGEEWWDNFCDY